jgi:RNA polymerase sigma-B factor
LACAPSTGLEGSDPPEATSSSLAGSSPAELETDELLLRAREASGAERQALLNEVIERHLPMADSVAGRYGRYGPDAEDLRQVARVGLVEAAFRYDPSRGNFASFAVPTILGLLKRHFRDHSWLIRPPRSTQELSVHIRSRWPEVAQKMGGEPRSADLAEQLQLPLDIVREAQLAGVGHTPFAMMTDDADLPSEDAHSEFERCEARIIVGNMLGSLSARERELLRLRFYARLSQEEIAALRGTNQMQVSRELTRLLAKLRALVGPIEDSADPGTGREPIDRDRRDRRSGLALSGAA